VETKDICYSVMLATGKLNSVMRTILTDGVEGACLMTTEGSPLCSVSLPEGKVSATGLAAISSSIWSNYAQGNQYVTFHLVELEAGCLGIVPTGKRYLLVAYGSNVTNGLLRGKMDTLASYFTRVFDELAA
jgi:hypothetical protein